MLDTKYLFWQTKVILSSKLAGIRESDPLPFTQHLTSVASFSEMRAHPGLILSPSRAALVRGHAIVPALPLYRLRARWCAAVSRCRARYRILRAIYLSRLRACSQRRLPCRVILARARAPLPLSWLHSRSLAPARPGTHGCMCVFVSARAVYSAFSASSCHSRGSRQLLVCCWCRGCNASHSLALVTMSHMKLCWIVYYDMWPAK